MTGEKREAIELRRTKIEENVSSSKVLGVISPLYSDVVQLKLKM